MTVQVIYIENDNLIRMNGAKLASTGAFVTAGTVTVRVQDENGQDVSGQTWPLSLSFVSGSNGDWIGILEEELQLVDGQNYTAVVDVDAGGDTKGHWEVPLLALKRTE